MPEIGQFVPQPGIDQISRADQSALPRQQLPEGEPSVPSSASLQLELPAVLFQPTLEQSLQESLRPELTDRAVLDPQKFQARVVQARESLSQLAREASSEVARQRFEDATQLLEEDRQLRNLLNVNLVVLQRA